MKEGDRESLCDALLPMPLAPHTRRSAARRFLSVWTLSLFLFSILWVGVRGAIRHPELAGVNVAQEQLTMGVDDQAGTSPSYCGCRWLTIIPPISLAARFFSLHRAGKSLQT